MSHHEHIRPILRFAVTLPVNRALIARGRGHALMHRYH